MLLTDLVSFTTDIVSTNSKIRVDNLCFGIANMRRSWRRRPHWITSRRRRRCWSWLPYNRLRTRAELPEERLTIIDASKVSKGDCKIWHRIRRAIRKLHRSVWLSRVHSRTESSQKGRASSYKCLGRKHGVPPSIRVVKVTRGRSIREELLCAHPIDLGDC